MPAAVIAVGAAAAGAVASSAVAGVLGAGLVGTVIGSLVGAAVTIGVSYLGHSLIGIEEPSLPEQKLSARSQMVRQPITHHRLVYGEVRVSGPIVFLHTRVPEDGNKFDILHLVVALAAHEVEAIGQIWFGDRTVPFGPDGAATDPAWQKEGTAFAHVWTHDGTPDQGADPVLVAEAGGLWGTNHRLRGRAYLHARLRYDRAIFQGGIPNIAAVVKGKRVWDPRTDTAAWSDNAALCVLDYLLSPAGLDAGLDEIDTASFMAAANICDEPVPTQGGSERRYTINGVVDLADAPVENLRALLTACAGHLSYTAGRWRLRVGAWYPAIVDFSDRDARDAVTVVPRRSRRELVNTVRGAFVSPAHGWQSTDYPPQRDPGHIANDGGEAALTLDLPFTTSHTMAQRIARIALEQNRREMQVTLPANLAGLRVAAGDTVALTLDRLGLGGRPFMVANWQLSPALGVDLTLWQDDPGVYRFQGFAEMTPPPGIVGGDNRDRPPAAPLGLSATPLDGAVRLDWSAAPGSDVDHYEVWEAPYAPEDPQNPEAPDPLDADGPAARLAEPRGNSWRHEGLWAGDAHWYWVRAVDSFGNAGAFAPPVDAAALGEPVTALILG
ncbi:MAG: hypothetical protein GVY13_15530 [Alphaproteobacteria bacterium]|jgi:hypothetical protein|nr:hypothetical protein [Alphaproteobacteria bacterium]